MGRENIYLSAQKIPASEEQSISDIYFNAVSVSSDPVIAGSDDGISPGNITENPQIGGGLGMRQRTGSITVAAESGDPTTAEFQTALQSVYSSSDPPVRGDLVSLKISGGTRLISRFLVMDNDSIAATGTVSFTVNSVTYYGLNLNYVSLEVIIEAIDDYFSRKDSMSHPNDEDLDADSSVASKSMPFTISLNNTYTNTAGVLTLSSSNPTVSVVAGSYEPMQGFSENINSGLTHDVTATLSDGSTVFILVFVKYIIEFTGTQGSRIIDGFKTGAEPQLEFIESQSPTAVEGGEFNATGSEYTHRDLVGIVGITTRGTRRTARIIQKFAGDQTGIRNFASKNAGSGADAAKGVTADMTKAGLREVTLCLNGHPYSTFILTGPLLAI